MKKKLLFIVAFAFSISNAAPVNWVVTKVNNEPITNYEVTQMMKMMKTNDKNRALEALINQKLQISEIKKQDIAAAPFEIDQQIQRMAKANGVSIEEFKARAKNSGISEAELRDETAKSIKQSKLLGNVFSRADEKVKPEDALNFYNQNKMLFMNFSAVNATRYAAQTKQEIVDVTRGKFGPKVFSHKITIPRAQLNNETAYVFMNMKNGTFTPVMQNPQGYWEVLRVDSKSGMISKNFEEVKPQILNMIAEKERAKAAESYFEKLRSEAVIEHIKR